MEARGEDPRSRREGAGMNWDYRGRYEPNEDDGVESDPSRSVLHRWRLLNQIQAPGMTDGFFRILSIIAGACPPGSELWKGRKQLAADAGVSLRNVERFYEWAYKTGVMQRQRGKRGFSDRVWPNYGVWLDYAAKAVQRISDSDRKAKEADRLEAFAVALGKDEAWVRGFRASMGTDNRSVPTDKLSGGVPTETTPPLPTSCRTRTGVSNRPFKQKGRTGGENGPAPERVPRRAPASPSSLSKKDPTTDSVSTEEKLKGMIEGLSKRMAL